MGFWDPLGLLKDADQERFDRLRLVETKHGRIAMLAVLGHIVTAKGDRIPGDVAFGVPYSSCKAGLAAIGSVPYEGIFQVVLFIGLMEFGFAGIQKDLEAFFEEAYPKLTDRRRKAVELNNGRAAQMGILGLMVHEMLNNDPYVLNSILGSPVPFNQ